MLAGIGGYPEKLAADGQTDRERALGQPRPTSKEKASHSRYPCCCICSGVWAIICEVTGLNGATVPLALPGHMEAVWGGMGGACCSTIPGQRAMNIVS